MHKVYFKLALLVAILDLSVTITPVLPLGRCVIMHKVYFKLTRAARLLLFYSSDFYTTQEPLKRYSGFGLSPPLARYLLLLGRLFFVGCCVYLLIFYLQPGKTVLFDFCLVLKWCQLYNSSAVKTIFHYRSQQTTFGNPICVFTVEK